MRHWDSIDSDNNFSPVRRQVITWSNADLLSIWPLGTNFSEIGITKTTFLNSWKCTENVVCEMLAILSRMRWVNSEFLWFYYTDDIIMDLNVDGSAFLILFSNHFNKIRVLSRIAQNNILVWRWVWHKIVIYMMIVKIGTFHEWFRWVI